MVQKIEENQKAQAVELLKELIRTPSLSGKEEKTAAIIRKFLEERGVEVEQVQNNVWCRNRNFSKEKPTILLNSHHDTVPPGSSYTRPPHEPSVEGGILYGLGSNDAGGPLVSLIATFLHFYERELPFNLILAATGEEENFGENGIPLLLPDLGRIDFGIVGEPTKMELAVAEKGLIVLDCLAHGVRGHAAREEGENSIYNAMVDIEWFRTYRFERESATLGPVKMNVTIIEGGSRHNVIPETCNFTVDVRTTDAYTNREVAEIIRNHVRSEVNVRSYRINPSGIDSSHPIVSVAKHLGIPTYGSPTVSDQARMSFPTVKIGPGDSARSHTADEYIQVEEIGNGIEVYVQILDQLTEHPIPHYEIETEDQRGQG
ncbi:MAG: M20 family metallo-hydrolase [Ignavibacteriae bacterium]|nr:M20 family metallo-hydrolase [Ignavibacteriota bacterium]MCB9215404.1 M20 family metallo-hydrolase [Ignavibacteria bacterium]